jgi:hypothetical protein
MICSVAPLIGGFDLSQDQPIGSPLDMSGEWAGSSKRQITSQMPAGRNRKASLPASTRPPTFSAVAALNNTPYAPRAAKRWAAPNEPSLLSSGW